jgi:glycosyltransferase involved in cell wall biosynthesis
MRIGIEAQRIFRKNKHGMDFVALEAIKQLQLLDKENEYYIFVAGGEDKCLGETNNFHIIELDCPTYPLWEQWALPRAVGRLKLDVLHCTSNTAPIYVKVPLVLTLHDIIFLEPRQGGNKSLYQNLGRVYRRFVVPKILSKCSKIITVSKFEKKRIGDFLKLPEDKLVAVYNGYNSYFQPIDNPRAVTKKYIPAEDYIFFLGNTDPKKNVPGTLKAYSLYLKQSKLKLPLLLADIKEDYLNSILQDEGISEIREHIVCPGYIENKDLPSIYSGAKVFLYTSFRESFGIPLLEAMACGTPVVTGNSSALPEIAGDGAAMVDVSKPELIADKLLELEDDESYYKSQVAYGLERVKLFSWKSTAEHLLEIYTSIK